MPTISVTTKSAKEVWRSGDRAIHELALDYNGQLFKAKTYSNAIAKEGWSGEVETYEKQGRYGTETFVKQPQKAYSGGGFQGGGRAPADQFSMYMSYAKDLVSAFITLDGKVNMTEFKKALKATIEGGHLLYAARPGAEPQDGPEPTPDAQVDTVAKELSEALGDDIEVVDEEGPWQNDEAPRLPT
jgi:hypothetical protein